MTWIKILSNIWKMHHFLRQFPISIMMMATHFAKLQAIASSAIAVGFKSIWKPSCSVRSIRNIKSIRSVRSLSVWEAGWWLVLVNEYWSVSPWGNKERDIFMEGSHLLTGESYYCAKEHVLINTVVGPTFMCSMLSRALFTLFSSVHLLSESKWSQHKRET